MITLDHVPRSERKFGEQYISWDFNPDVKFIDCQLIVNQLLFLWSIGFDRDTRTVRFYDCRMRGVSLEEFIEIVETKTPKYISALLFLIPDPVGYFEALSG